MNKISAKLGRRIKEYRRTYQLTQEQLANKLGVCSRFIISLEKGEGNPRLDILYKISRDLNISLDSLCTDDPSADNAQNQILIRELSTCTEAEVKIIYPVVHQLIISLGLHNK